MKHEKQVKEDKIEIYAIEKDYMEAIKNVSVAIKQVALALNAPLIEVRDSQFYDKSISINTKE